MQMTRPKRKYNRLAPSTWAEICALWEIGDVTLPELAERYSVSTRTLQTHFAKHKVEKGSKAAALATSVKEESSLTRAINSARKAGLHVMGITADGTVLVSDTPVDPNLF